LVFWLSAVALAVAKMSRHDLPGWAPLLTVVVGCWLGVTLARRVLAYFRKG
jgi:hypothetical protein